MWPNNIAQADPGRLDIPGFQSASLLQDVRTVMYVKIYIYLLEYILNMQSLLPTYTTIRCYTN